MVKPLVIGLIGFGNIGAGVVRLLAESAELHASRLPRPMVLKTICDKDTQSRRDAPYDPDGLVADAEAVLGDPEIDVVVELIGGLEPARTFVETALRRGKHVVTANKHLLAHRGAELMALAAAHGVGLLYEAAVGGGIPIVRALQQGLSANAITCVEGILNGTCNYILTRMSREEGVAFEQVLADAQKAGYAEPDPTYDIEGYDTAHKTAILASLAFGMDVRFEDVSVEGITAIQPVDFQYAARLGYAIKLLGIARRDPESEAIEARVHPTLVPLASPLGRVDGVFNGILVEGDPIGTTMYYGRGAGAGPTASAVVSDLMALAADAGCFNAGRDARLKIRAGHKAIKPMAELQTHYYVRFTMADRPGAMALIGKALADREVSIESMIQQPCPPEEAEGSLATISIVTHKANEAALQAALAEIERHSMSMAKAFVMRVEE
jgi:homoserine dehydrogenase